MELRRVRMLLAVGAVVLCQAVLASVAGAFTFSHAPGSPYGVGAFAYSGAVGDFNGDGLADFAVGINTPAPINPGGTASVSVLLADGAGGFRYAGGSAQRASTELGEAGMTPVATADFNGDGRLDLAASDASDVWILPGNGDGTFGSPLSKIPDGRYPVREDVADFNGDGKPDLAVGNQDGTTSIYLGSGDGTFTQAPGSPIAGGLIGVRDFNGDGKPDLLVGSASGSSESVSVLLGDGDGTFGPAPGSPSAIPAGSFAVADFNGDGKPDVASRTSTGVSVLLGNGDGSFRPGPTSPIPPSYTGTSGGVVVADFNGDGDQDLASAGGNFESQSATVDLLLGDGTGRFRAAHGSPFPLGAPGSAYQAGALAAGSFDGRPGLLVSYGQPYIGSVAVLLAPLPSDPPIAALKAWPASPIAGGPALLDASASSDPLDRPIVGYRWDLGNGRFDHDTGATPWIRWRFAEPGATQVRVQVTNSAGQTATTTLPLVVQAPPPPRRAVVAGRVQVCGGPAPGRCRVEKIGLCTPARGCMTSDRVAAIDSRGRRVAVAKLRRGRFRMVLNPGRYTIQLLGDGKRVHGRVMQRARVFAHAHRTASIRFRFDVP